MARPRRYRHIRNDRIRFSDHDNSYNSEWLFEAGYHPFSKQRCDQWRREAGWANRRARPSTIRYPSINGRNDPLSAMLVLDCLMRIEPESTIQANALTTMLTDNYPQMIWDTITVGVIMASFADVTADIIIGDMPVFARQRTSGIYYFIINPSLEARHWMGNARDRLGELAETAVKLPPSDHGSHRSATLWDEIGTVSTE